MFGANEIVGKKYFKDASENKLFVTSMFMTLQGEGPYRGEPAFFIRLAKCNLACSFCFVGDTPITMAGGTFKKIKDVKVGDKVVTWDNGVWTEGTVTNTFVRETNTILKLEFSKGKEVFCTPEHPFYVKDKGWTKAQDLNENDIVLHYPTAERMRMYNPMKVEENAIEVSEAQISNGYSLISKKEITNDGTGKGSNGKAWVRLSGAKDMPVTVYNFEVEKTHNYVANGLLVHNCDTFFDDGDWLTFDEIEERIEQTIDQFYANKGKERPNWTRHTKRVTEDALPDMAKNVTTTVFEPKQMVLVMTGGEPMLQENIGPFLERMSYIFKNTQIESNGTQATEIPATTTLVVSPKCLEKKDPVTGKMVPIKYLTPRREVLERANCLKFVMEATEGSPYNEVPDWALEWKRVFNRPIFVSPMNQYNDLPQKAKKKRAESNSISIEERSTVDEVISFWEPGLLDMEENQRNHEYAAMYCVEHGLILNLQIHLYASLA